MKNENWICPICNGGEYEIHGNLLFYYCKKCTVTFFDPNKFNKMSRILDELVREGQEWGHYDNPPKL